MGNDEFWMRRALELARLGMGLTRPNPPVGAVIVRNGKMMGRGWHRRAGTPHAEILALREAGSHARGATLYVTLEPCCTQGRTPPCTDAIIAAGIRRVVAAVRDPNPRHAGRGLRLLRRHGLEVKEGVCRLEAAALIVPFARWIVSGRPYVTLKLALTVDGKIADARRRARWITGAEARREVQALRRAADAVMVGSGTVRADNPLLLPHPARGRKPWRVILAGRGSLPLDLAVFQPPYAAQTILATTARCPSSFQADLEKRGVQVWRLPAGAGGRVLLKPLLRRLARLGVLHVLCEGGGELAAALVHARLVDEFVFFVAPCLLGGDGVSAVGGRGWLLQQAPRLRFTEMRKIGADVLLRAEPLKI